MSAATVELGGDFGDWDRALAWWNMAGTPDGMPTIAPYDTPGEMPSLPAQYAPIVDAAGHLADNLLQLPEGFGQFPDITFEP
jgi:hypothetical protein